MIIFNTCDQIALKLTTVTQIDHLNVDLVSEYPNMAAQVEKRVIFEFWANLGSLDRREEIKIKVEITNKPRGLPDIKSPRNCIFWVPVVYMADGKNHRGLGIGVSSNDHFNTCDQMAPRLAAVTQIDYFLVD